MRIRANRVESLEPRIAMAADIAGIFGNFVSLASDLNVELDEVDIRAVAQADDTLHVLSNRKSGDVELWRTDDAAQELARTAELESNMRSREGAYHDSSTQMISIGDRIYFTFTVPTSDFLTFPQELWEISGTPLTTRQLVADFGEWSAHPQLFDHDGSLFMPVTTSVDSSYTGSFWFGDETPERYSHELHSFFDIAAIASPTRLGDSWYFIGGNFAGPDEIRGVGLWATNPRTESLAEIKRFEGQDLGGGEPHGLTRFKDTLYFAADAGDGHEIWKSDGTPEGTQLLKQIGPSGKGSQPRAITVTEDGLLLLADDGEGERLWFSDGTEAGTIKLPSSDPRQALRPEYSHGRQTLAAMGSVPTDLRGTVHQQQDLNFSISTSNGLWVTDGSDSGTKHLGAGLSIVGEYNGQPVIAQGSNLLLLEKEDLSLQLLGKIPQDAIATMDAAPHDLTVLGGRLYFVTKHDGNLYTLDENGIVREVAGDLNFSPASRFKDFRTQKLDGFDEKLVAFHQDGLSVLNTSDQTTDLIYSGSPVRSYMKSHDGTLYFSVTTSSPSMLEIWTSDGTVQGTKLLAAEAHIEAFATPRIEYANERIFFLDRDQRLRLTDSAGKKLELGTHRVSAFTSNGDEILFLQQQQLPDHQWGNQELWRSDGTVAGTRRIFDLPPNDGNYAPEIASANGSIFIADGGRLYHSDGTVDGTTLLTTLSSVSNLSVHDGRLFFAANDGVHGTELWVSDGTAAGTQLAADLRPGDVGSSPADITILDDQLFFSADDGRFGRELWQMNLETWPLSGDANGNSHVTFADFLVLAANFGRQTEQGFADGDFDLDGKVGFLDFLILAENFGR